MGTPTEIHAALKEKGTKAADGIAKRVERDRSLLKQVVEGTRSSDKRVKNAAGLSPAGFQLCRLLQTALR